MVGVRRKAREAALKVLYEVDLVGHSPERALEQLVIEGDLPQEAAEFSRELVLGVMRNKPAIDEVIRRYATSWPLEQISPIDRNVLQVAIFEILFNNKVPVKAAINEAVELAKTFGSDNSPKFVNGVLGTVKASIVG